MFEPLSSDASDDRDGSTRWTGGKRGYNTRDNKQSPLAHFHKANVRGYSFADASIKNGLWSGLHDGEGRRDQRLSAPIEAAIKTDRKRAPYLEHTGFIILNDCLEGLPRYSQ